MLKILIFRIFILKIFRIIRIFILKFFRILIIIIFLKKFKR